MELQHELRSICPFEAIRITPVIREIYASPKRRKSLRDSRGHKEQLPEPRAVVEPWVQRIIDEFDRELRIMEDQYCQKPLFPSSATSRR